MTYRKRSLLAGCAGSTLALLLVGQAMAQSAPARLSEGASSVDDIIVTATKRPERVRDIAGGMTAVSNEQLQQIGAQSFADYLGRQPGVVFNEGPSGNSTAIIRGVGTTIGLDQGQGPTGYYLDEVPLTEPGYAVGIPDIDTFDVERVEVLRGPQGTLFGSSSLGGAINYVSRKADPSAYDSALEGTYSMTRHAGELNYSGKAMINLPIIQDQLAVRGVYIYRQDAGYLDNVGLDRKGSNDVTVRGGRVSIAWTPSDATKVTWLSLYQSNDTADSSIRWPELGERARYSLVPTPFNLSMELHALRLEQDLGFATLTAQASYNKKDHHLEADLNDDYAFLGLPNRLSFYEDGVSESTTFEIRLASQGGSAFNWLLGVTRTDVDKTYTENFFSPGSGAILGPLNPPEDLNGDTFYWGYGDTKGIESAVFGEASYRFAQDWTLTAGGRLFKTEIEGQVGYFGIFYPGGSVPPGAKQSEDGFAPKLSLKYQPNSDLMVYALASQGFRFGNLNTIFPLVGFDTPTGWKTDFGLELRTRWAHHMVRPTPSARHDGLLHRLVGPAGSSGSA